jgi:hypothetical protein
MSAIGDPFGSPAAYPKDDGQFRSTINSVFPDQVRWAVSVGRNKSGKPIIVRVIAPAMLAERDVEASRIPESRWRTPIGARRGPQPVS